MGFLLALGVIFVWLYLRGNGLYPAVFADEWYYSKMSRLAPLAESLIPSYLYLWAFGASNACGAAFLDCARIGNLVLHGAALPFFYLVARRHTSQGYAWLLTLFCAAMPLNAFTLYFMPETAYWFGFSVLSWIALTGDRWRPGVQATAAGFVLGAMSLVKVHALFLLPALCLYLLHASWIRGGAPRQWLSHGLAGAVLASVAALAVKFGLGWVLAGDAALSVFGPFYQSNISSGSTAMRMALLAPILVSAQGHLMAIAVLLGLPLAILVHGLTGGRPGQRRAPIAPLQAWVALMLSAAVCMAIIYTASLAARDALEGVRLHLRYYSFVFPLLWLVAAASARTWHGPQQTPADGRQRAWPRWMIAAVLALVVLIAFQSLPTYQLSVIDGPDIAGINMRSSSGHVTVVLQLALLAAWAGGRWNAARLFVLVLLPMTILVSQERIASFTQGHRSATTGDRAGQLVRTTVPLSERARVTVVGEASELPQLMRVQFHIDHADTTVLTLAKGAPVPRQQIPAGRVWLLVMGRHAAPFATVVHQTDEFTLLRLPVSGAMTAATISSSGDPAVSANDRLQRR